MVRDSAFETKRQSVTIIGAGPRGTSILERISSLPYQIISRLHINIVDRNSFGSGIHAVDQPGYFVTNTVSGDINLFRCNDIAADGDICHGPSLAEWANVDPNAYVSRALLGQYLAWVHERLQAHALKRGLFLLQNHPHSAINIRRAGDRAYAVGLSNGVFLEADAVFIATGHGLNEPSDEEAELDDVAKRHRGRNPRLRMIRCCYPLADLDDIGSEARVLVRGMSLSAIDTVAALTEGRGGRFLARPYGDLRYLPSGSEPKIDVYSRSGRIFWPRARNQKTNESRFQPRHLTKETIAALRLAKGRLDFTADVLPRLMADMRLAAGAAQQAPSFFELRQFIRSPEKRHFDPLGWHQSAIVSFLAEEERRAKLGNLTDPIKLATDAIRDMRDELREAVEHRSLSETSYTEFRRSYAPTLNILSAGPPAYRAQQWRALIEARVLTITQAPQAQIAFDHGSAAYCLEASSGSEKTIGPFDVVIGASIDAFIPMKDRSPLVRSLIASGLARPFAYGEKPYIGFDIDSVGRLVAKTGNINECLYVVGHLTEGPHYFTNMLPSPHASSRVTADAARAVNDMIERWSATSARSRLNLAS